MIIDPHALTGRSVLVTGASGAIGAAIAATVGAAGATVLAAYRSRPAEAERALLAVPPERKRLLASDLGDPAGARDLWHRAADPHPPDVLVVNAAAIPTTAIDGSDEDWDAGWEQTMRVNVIGAAALMREAVRAYAARGSGTVIAISSWAAEQGSRIPDVSAYAASKAALRNLAQTLARAYARAGVGIHVVAPGVVAAGMGIQGLTGEQIHHVAEGLAMGRLVDVREVAEVVAFLAAGSCPSLSGATIDLNGASYIR